MNIVQSEVFILMGGCLIFLGIVAQGITPQKFRRLSSTPFRAIIASSGTALLIVGLVGLFSLAYPENPAIETIPSDVTVAKRQPVQSTAKLPPELTVASVASGLSSTKHNLTNNKKHLTNESPVQFDESLRHRIAGSSFISVHGTHRVADTHDIWVIVWPGRANGRGWPQMTDPESATPAWKKSDTWHINCHLGGPDQAYRIDVYSAPIAASQTLRHTLVQKNKDGKNPGLLKSEIPTGFTLQDTIKTLKKSVVPDPALRNP